MVMDSQFRGYYGPRNGIKVNDETLSVLSGRNIVNGFKLGGETFFDKNLVDTPPFSSHQGLSPDLAPSSHASSETDLHHEDCDLSNVVLKNINRMLMEEDMEESLESSALQAAEKSFYEVIGEKYPPPPNLCPRPFDDQNLESPDENYAVNHSNCNSSSSTSSSNNLMDPGWNCELGECIYPHIASQSSWSSSNSCSNVIDEFADSPVSTTWGPDILNESESVMKIRRGVEEEDKLLLNGNTLFVDLESNGLLSQQRQEEAKDVVVNVEKKHESEYFKDGSRGKKKSHPVDVDLEERSYKQSAVYTEETLRSELFDLVLLCNEGKSDSALREAIQNEASKNVQQNGQTKGSNGGKARGKRQGGKKDLVDLRSLLTLCAQAVATWDRRSADGLLKQIRQHSSPTGDGMQRLAHYFANGLEARLAGSGTQIYTTLLHRPTSAIDILKAYHLFLAVCPFKKLLNFFSNRTIAHVSEKATRLHIIDFGILYGFQWPCLIQRLSSRPGGPPKLRITGIDLPQPGFRPAERVEETGRRLANYAETFNVPFEFNAVAKKWETIQIDDLKIRDDEVLVVNCLHRFRNLLDETVMVESPRDIVLNLIRKINPDVFVQGIVNGAYSAPFFITRFREALFHFSTMFDLLETNVPREIPERMLIEKEIFGREAMNVIACEGPERIERPETYKQWQVRNLRAGFRQLPLNEEILKMAKERVKSWYHKDFAISVDGQWMLQGWKGRIAYAISCWKSAY